MSVFSQCFSRIPPQRRRNLRHLPAGAFAMAAVLLSAGCDQNPTIEEVWRLSDFANPESAVYDPARDEIYISNVNGPPNEKNALGFISRVSPGGEFIERNWLEGLNAPKGMRLSGDTLYIADVDQLAVYNIQSGEMKFYPAPLARFLNDVAIGNDGAVYVSDMKDDAIYRLKDDVFAIWLKDEGLESPNGLMSEGNGLIVGSWGPLVSVDSFETTAPGSLKRVDLADKSITVISDPLGNLDGVEPNPAGAGYTVTDWVAGGLWLIDEKGATHQWLDLDQGSADHHVLPQTGLIVIPMMLNNEVIAYKVAADTPY